MQPLTNKIKTSRLGGLYYESIIESILNVGSHLIDDGYDEFIMITADPLHV